MYNSIIPYAAYTEFTPALPEFYWDVYSAEQRIKHMCYELCKINAYCDYLAKKQNELGQDVEDTLKALFDELDDWKKKLYNEIIRLISDLQVGSLQWDVQHGYYIDSQEAMRDMFNDVTVHSITVGELNELDMTVESLAECGLNVRGLAVMSYWLKSKFELLPEYRPQPSSGNKLTIDEIINAEINGNGFIFIPKGE
jgi:hypothetical protein